MTKQPVLQRRLGAATLALAIILSSGCATDGVTDNSQTTDFILGPLDEFRIRIWGSWAIGEESPADMLARHDQQHREFEDHVSTCMAELGFTYYPNITRSEIHIPTDMLAENSREFAEQYGFGYSTFPARVSIGASSGEWSNARLWNEMSEPEREAWNYALFGEIVEGHVEEFGGCFGLAVAAQQPITHGFESLYEEMNNLPLSRVEVQDYQALVSEWRSCMIEYGHSDWSDPMERSPLFDEWISLNPYTTQGRGWDFAANPSGPPTLDVQVHLDFTEREISIALANWDCRDLVNFDQRLHAIDLGLQNRFVAAHLKELEAWAQQVEATTLSR